MRSVLGVLLFLLFGPALSFAQDLSALARLDAAASAITDQGETVRIDLALSQPVPWRVRLADNPPA
ncbi:MAG: hypothetical protein R3D90_16445 [Paracoccaceae bacterium]